MKTSIATGTRILGFAAALLPSLSPALTNGGFENDLAGWQTTGNVAVKSAAPYAPTEGNKLVAFNPANTTGPAGIYQELVVDSGHSYVVEFDVGNLGYNPKPQSIEALVGGTDGTITYQLAGRKMEIPGTTGGRTNWVSGSLTFTPLAGRSPVLAFWDRSTISDGLDLVLDNVRIREIPPGPLVFGNGSFESGFEGWFAGGDVSIKSDPPYLASDGSHLAVFNSGDSPPDGYISRNIGTVPGQRYLLLYDLGNLSYNGLPQEMGVVVGGNLNPTGGYLVFQTIGIPGPTRGATAWLSPAHEFTAYSTSTDLTFFDTSVETRSTDLVLDNIRVIPAPPKGQFINGSFEYGFDGWLLDTTNGKATIESGAPYQPTDGDKVVAFNSHDTRNFAHLSQTVDTEPGKTYQLVFDVGNLAYVGYPQTLRVIVSDGESYGYVLLNRTETLAAPTSKGNTNRRDNVTYPFVARGTRTNFLFIDASTTTKGLDLVLDNVRLHPVSP